MNGLDALVAQIHPVDKSATLVWCAFVHTRPSVSPSVSALRMFYGARYWPKVKRAIIAHEATGPLESDALRVAESATRTTRVDRDQLVGIAIAGLMLAETAGEAAFAAMPDEVPLPGVALLETPTMVLQRRARNTPEGLLGRWRGARRRWRVTFEPDPSSHYTVVHGGLLAPCRGGNHEHCEVGIIAGADRLSPADGGEPFPIIRRACETRVFGRVSLLAAP